MFGVAASPGLTNVLRDGAPVHIHRMSHGLSFLASGDRPRNPSELLQSPAFEEQLARFAGEYDIVLIDTPPILAVTDAAIVGRLAGTVYLVLRAGRHPVAEISLADERLRQHGIEPRAAILNGLETRPRIAGAYRNYLYHYEYR